MTFIEFKSWLIKLILEKDGALPDYDDWFAIKKKLDSVDSYDTLQLTDMDLEWTDESYGHTSTWWGVDNALAGDGNFNVTWEFQSMAPKPDPAIQLTLDLEDMMPTTGYIQVPTEESLQLGADLQLIKEEMKNGQKESD